MPITFNFEDKTYRVENIVTHLNRIALPDRRVLNVTCWLEGNPPQPKGLHLIPHIFSNLQPEEIADIMTAAPAIEIYSAR